MAPAAKKTTKAAAPKAAKPRASAKASVKPKEAKARKPAAKKTPAKKPAKKVAAKKKPAAKKVAPKKKSGAKKPAAKKPAAAKKRAPSAKKLAIKHFHSNAKLSEMVIHNGIVYTAGQVAGDDSINGDIVAQMKDITAQIDKLLAEAGTNKSRILRVQIYLVNLADFAGMNEVYMEWLKDLPTPARATVLTPLVDPKWRVELIVTAAQ